MHARFDTSLEALRSRLRTGAATRSSVLRELSNHLEDHTSELMRQRGLSREEASTEALRTFGDLKEIASDLSFVHNQGTWRETALSALPHLVVALLFASHQWLEPVWLGAALLLTGSMSALGWRMGRPIWMYPWLGYTIFPFLLAGTVSIATMGYGIWAIVAHGYTPTNPMSWVLGMGLGVVGITLISYLLIWVSHRDWTHAALLVLPIPFLSVALLAFDRGTYTRLEEADIQTGLLFMFVALAVGVVVRLGDRTMKISLIGASLPIGFLLSSGALETELRALIAMLLSLPALLLVLAPYLLSLGAPSPSLRPHREPRRHR